MVMKFYSSRRLFHHHVLPTQYPRGPAVLGFKQVLNRLDATGASISTKVDGISASLADLTLILRQKAKGGTCW